MGNTNLTQSFCRTRFSEVKELLTENEILEQIETLQADDTFIQLINNNSVKKYFQGKFDKAILDAEDIIRKKTLEAGNVSEQKDRTDLAKKSLNETISEIKQCVNEFKTKKEKPIIANIILAVVSKAAKTAITLFDEDMGLSIRTYVRLYAPQKEDEKNKNTVSKSTNQEQINVSFYIKEETETTAKLIKKSYGPFSKVFFNSKKETIFTELDNFIMSNIKTKKRVLNIVMCGVSGSGKTYTTQQFIQNYTPGSNKKNEYSYGITSTTIDTIIAKVELFLVNNQKNNHKTSWVELFEFIKKQKITIDSINKDDKKIRTIRNTPLNENGSSRCIDITEYKFSEKGTLRLFDMPGNEQYFSEQKKTERSSIIGMRKSNKFISVDKLFWIDRNVTKSSTPVINIGSLNYSLRSIIKILLENLAINTILTKLTDILKTKDANKIENFLPQEKRTADINKILLFTCVKNEEQASYDNTKQIKSLQGTKQVLQISESVSSSVRNRDVELL